MAVGAKVCGVPNAPRIDGKLPDDDQAAGHGRGSTRAIWHGGCDDSSMRTSMRRRLRALPYHERNAFEGLSPWREVRVLIIDLEYMSGARVLIVRCLYCASCFNRTVSVVYSCVARARVCML